MWPSQMEGNTGVIGCWIFFLSQKPPLFGYAGEFQTDVL
jgi:hypothetical protein